MTSTLSDECLSLGDVTSSGKAKTAPFSVNGGPAEFSLCPLKIAFEPSAYQDNDATRVNIVFKVNLVHEEELGQIDKWILDTVSADPARFFGKAKTRESLVETYTPCVKQTEKYGSQFKCKLNLPGSYQGVRVWDLEKLPRAPPDTWAGCVVTPLVRFRHLYFMANQWGPVIDVTDLKIHSEAASVCPF